MSAHMPPIDAQPFDEDAAKRIANIIGENSAAAMALKDVDLCRSNGIECALMYSQSTHSFLVFYDRDRTN